MHVGDGIHKLDDWDSGLCDHFHLAGDPFVS
jgi:hypothetical protein